MYMGLDSNNRPNGWDIEPWGNAIEVDDLVYQLASEHPDWVWNGIELIPVPAPPPRTPTQEEIIAEITTSLETCYDTKAQERRYDNRLTCALRAGYAGPFQAEGTAFAIWMDNCNAYAYQVMAECLAGTRAIPTAEELISELPVLVWP